MTLKSPHEYHNEKTSSTSSRPDSSRKHSNSHIPAIKRTFVVVVTAWVLNAQPQIVSGHEHAHDSVTQKSFSFWLTTTTTTITMMTLWHVQPVTSISPVDQLIQDIMASNRSEEEKFQAVLVTQHRRYCESSRTCNSGVKLGNCGYCKPCRCDDGCLHYGDCCPDKLLEDVDKAQPLGLVYTCRDNLYAGYTVEQRKSRLANATSYLMTASCPAATPPSLAYQCEDQSKFLPVSVLNKYHQQEVEVFANKHCAQCHGLDATSAEPWKTMLHCTSTKNFTSSVAQDMAREAANDNDCFLVYFPPPLLPSPRQCFYDDSMISTCNVTGAWLERDDFVERACGVYVDPKVEEGKVFQNVFCYICNSADPDLFEKLCANSGLSPMPFSALLDFSGAIYGRAEDDLMAKCDDSEIYDDTSDECRSVHCSPRRYYMDGQCPVVFNTAKGLGYSLYFSVSLEHDLDLYDENDFLHTLPGSLESLLTWITLDATVRFTSFEVSFEITDLEGRCSQKSRLFSVFSTMRVMADVNLDEFEHQLLGLRNTTLSNPRLSLNFTTHVDEGVWLAAMKFGAGNQASRACSTKVANHHTMLEGDADTVYTRVDNLLTVPKIALTREEFHIQTADLSLTIPWLHDENIPLEEYESTSDGNVYISLDDFVPKITAYRKALQKERDKAEVILSIVCTTLSLAGLTLTFFTYAVFKPLRTTPGKNNMNLCLTLFLAQLFYLVGSGRTEVPGLCQAMGILIHYFWLTAFAAMSVCSYHMWRVFTSIKTADDDSDQRRRFLQYTVYIWGAAAAVVVLTLLAHIIITEGDTIGYGGQQCYLSTSLGVGVAVGVPVAITVIASIIFFSLTVRTIRQSPKLTKSREDERHVWVYFKLSTLTGATWTLAFVVFFTEVTVLRYVFTLVNGLQGLFICISFVFNRRVFKLYLSCWMGGHSRLTSTTSGSGSTSASSSYRNATTVSAISRRTETSFSDTNEVKT